MYITLDFGGTDPDKKIYYIAEKASVMPQLMLSLNEYKNLNRVQIF